jgi:dipeptidyl aminopeptidase/acylaminoacyl peptidase
MRERMLKAAANARIPVLLIQAENDYDLGPTRELFAEMTRLGKPCRMRIFPAYGDSTTKGAGHLFGYAAPSQWSPEVFRFLEEHVNSRTNH